MKYLFVKCPIGGCSYKTGASHKHDHQARLALIAHLKRKTHAVDHATAKDLAGMAQYVEEERCDEG